jgi:hypothetical protein
MSELVTELGRSFIREASKELNLYDKYARFYRYWREVNKAGKCVDADEILHHVDNVFIPILENTNQLAVAVDNNSVPRYYRNRFTKALSTRDKEFIRWFLRNYVMNYTDVDAVVSNNYVLLPWVFNYGFYVCPITGGSCASNAAATCVSITELPQTPVCCTGSTAGNGGNYFILVDNAPWVSSYSTNAFGISTQVPTSPGTFTLTGSVTGPSCFPSSGVTLNLDIINYINLYSSTACASSCPSGTVCGNATIPNCPGTTQSKTYVPILYYNVGLTVLPNTAYSVWWQASVS